MKRTETSTPIKVITDQDVVIGSSFPLLLFGGGLARFEEGEAAATSIFFYRTTGYTAVQCRIDGTLEGRYYQEGPSRDADVVPAVYRACYYLVVCMV